MKQLHALLAAVGFVFASQAALGQTEPQKGAPGGASRDLEQQFKALDRDGDGFLSRAEVEQNASLAAALRDADKNGDAKLDLSEFRVLQATGSPDRSYGAAPATGAGAGSTKK